MKRIITFGTFDLLHSGHLRILERAKAEGGYLIVGVSTDKLNSEKGKYSVFPQSQRRDYVQALECVDETFFEDSLELKDDYIKELRADLLVMGDDWAGKFDWVSCDVKYLERTPGVSSTLLKTDIAKKNSCRNIIFADTYVQKHYDCALPIVNELTQNNIAPILTQTKEIQPGLNCDCLVYFNLPAAMPPACYDDVPKVLIDHGASVLKWFLANKKRYEFFDTILTAGPDHVNSLSSFFPEKRGDSYKVKSAGFIKSKDILCAPKMSRKEVCELANLDPDKPIILFAPTWYLNSNVDMVRSVQKISQLDNVVTSLHPETMCLDFSSVNVLNNQNGMTTELMKHAEIVISDTSSTIFEAAAIGKKTVQILLREYSDNNSVLFDFPYVAGTADLFCGGVSVRPGEINQTVEKLLAGDEDLTSCLNELQNRILSGTNISDSATHNIANELRLRCENRNSERVTLNIDELAEAGLDHVHRRMKFSGNRVIAHAGGDFERLHASNSKEAITAAMKCLQYVEVDIVKGKDGLLVAHDGFESRYGLEKPFRETEKSEFAVLRYGNKLSTISLEDVFAMAKSSDKFIVCDVKGTGEEYAQVVKEIYLLANEKKVLKNVVMQCYCVEDFKIVNALGFKNSLLAVWKYFYLSPLGQDAYNFVGECNRINPNMIVGISIPFTNKHMAVPAIEDSRIAKWFSFWKRIYIHGAPKNQYPNVLRKNLGLFADSFSSANEFKDAPNKFSWRQYLFLNPLLVDAGVDNHISAVNHFMDYGNTEKRVHLYDIPDDFRWSAYMDINPELKSAGVAGADSAKAHWTRYGQFENRRYQ